MRRLLLGILLILLIMATTVWLHYLSEQERRRFGSSTVRISFYESIAHILAAISGAVIIALLLPVFMGKGKDLGIISGLDSISQD